MKTIFSKQSLLLVATIFGIYSTNAQSLKIKQLSVGDQVPNIKMQTMVQYGKPSATIADFKNRLLILDFWSIWCGGCINAMPELERLQKKYNDRITILPVSFTRSKQEVEAFFTKMKKNGNPINLPSAIYNTRKNDMMGLFPCYGFPMEVWISGSGQVLAISDSFYITEANIEKALRNENLNLPLSDSYIKAPIKDAKKQVNETQNTLFSSRLTKYTDTLTGSKHKARFLNKMRGDKFTRLSIYNSSVIDLFKASIYGTLIQYLNNDHISVEIADSASLFFPMLDTCFKKNMEKNTYCYDLILPKNLPYEKAIEFMYQDLSLYFGISATKEQRETDCWVIKQITPTFNLTAKSDKEDMGGDESIGFVWQKNMPISHLASWISSLKHNNPLVLDETGYTKVDIEITLPKTNDINAINEVLKKYNLYLEPAKRMIEKIILRKSSV